MAKASQIDFEENLCYIYSENKANNSPLSIYVQDLEETSKLPLEDLVEKLYQTTLNTYVLPM